MSCNCSGLSAGETLPRSLSNLERADFLARHPVVATYIHETSALQAIGVYDYDYNPYEGWKLPGVIPPWGMAVLNDSHYGNVVIFPARDGSIRMSGFVPSSRLGDVNDPAYVATGTTIPDVLNDVSAAISNALVPALIMVGLYLGFQAYQSSRGRK